MGHDQALDTLVDAATVIIGRKIREARETEGLSQSDLARLLGKTQTAVSYWESGRRSPGVEELLQVAEALGRDIGELLPPRQPSATAPAVLRAEIDKLENETLSVDLQEFLERAERFPPLEMQISVSEDRPVQAAQQLLSRAEETQPPINVEGLAQMCGVRVLNWRFDDALSGLVVDLENGPVIGVNSRHPRVRRRFTIGHELGHYLLRHRDRFYIDLRANPEHGDPPGYHPRFEREANEFAANALMPAALVRNEYVRHRSIDGMAKLFDVSDLGMSYRLVNLGLRE